MSHANDAAAFAAEQQHVRAQVMPERGPGERNPHEPPPEEEPAPCPLCSARVERGRLAARMICTGCAWEFVPPGGGPWTPERILQAWEVARR